MFLANGFNPLSFPLPSSQDPSIAPTINPSPLRQFFPGFWKNCSSGASFTAPPSPVFLPFPQWPVRLSAPWLHSCGTGCPFQYRLRWSGGQPYVHVVAFEFRKAFDTIRHRTLFEKIADFPLPDFIYNWLIGSFSNRTHQTRFNGSFCWFLFWFQGHIIKCNSRISFRASCLHP